MMLALKKARFLEKTNQKTRKKLPLEGMMKRLIQQILHDRDML